MTNFTTTHTYTHTCILGAVYIAKQGSKIYAAMEQ